MIGMKSLRIVAWSLSGAVHVVLIAGLLALWPAPPKHAPVARDSRATPGLGQRSMSPRRPSSMITPRTVQSAAPDILSHSETLWALVPVMVARASNTVGDRILNHVWQSTLFAF